MIKFLKILFSNKMQIVYKEEEFLKIPFFAFSIL